MMPDKGGEEEEEEEEEEAPGLDEGGEGRGEG